METFEWGLVPPIMSFEGTTGPTSSYNWKDRGKEQDRAPIELESDSWTRDSEKGVLLGWSLKGSTLRSLPGEGK